MTKSSLPKRIVLSRKGFDSGTGCLPSPILGDMMLSLPIPDRASPVSYGDLSFGGHSFGKLVTDVKAKRRSRNNKLKLLSVGDRAHLDPDLIPGVLPRKPGWLPTYGQCGKDATILRNHQVGTGDLFVF